MDTFDRRQIGEFVIQGQIGNGGFATVYRAYQPSVNRSVAIKIISLQDEALVEDGMAFERRFAQEAQVLASLEHPHIVPIYHYGIAENEAAYIAMRLMRGSLRELLREGPLPPDRVVDIILQLMTGLGYAHRQGVIHRNLKPGNILFDEAGSACLTDFGLVRASSQTFNFTQPSLLMETAMYVSPEQIRSAGADHRSDIYSLGVIMYQMLTGRLPFEADNLSVASLLHKIEYDKPVPLHQFTPEITPEIERVVLQALRKEPRERFFDIQEMTEALEASSRSHVGRQHGIPSLVIPPLNRQSSRRWIIVGISAVIVIVLILMFGALARQINLPTAPTILADQRGTVSDAAPSASEIAQAQRQLGSSGFIAYIACGLDSQFEAARASEMHDFAEAYGLRFQTYDGEDDPYKVLTLIEQARLDGARALILCPLKPSLLADSLRSIQSAGIPFVLTDALPQSSGGVMIDPNDLEIGRLAGQSVGEALAANGGSRVVILDDPDASYSDMRVQGFTDGLQSVLPEAQIVGRYPVGDNEFWQPVVYRRFARQRSSDRRDLQRHRPGRVWGGSGAERCADRARCGGGRGRKRRK